VPNLNVQSESDVRTADGETRKHIVLTGILQGIGCRPTVYRLATRLGLGGWVINTTSGVIIEVEGSLHQCESFARELPGAIPFPGRIDSIREEEISPLGESAFRIDASMEGERSVTPIPPDVAVCAECVEELLDPRNPRYLYPFTTCTLCGPRFTVVRSFPYDRERTSMADFTMCPMCREEYETPNDRRFHSQTNSCPQCGPKLELTDAKGNTIEGDPVLRASAMLGEGEILGIKGIGGFHLACDARNRDAVALLRERKGRVEKPFAVMMPDLETVRRYCRVNAVEERLVTSPIAPIVLLDASGDTLADNVAPMMGTLGVMLPYSPVHHLFFKHPEVPQAERLTALVMTSGNRSEEPIARDNEEALQSLGDLADAFLFHNREIVLRADDSIFRVIQGLPTVFRRSRGLVPGGFKVERPDIGSPEDGSGGDAGRSDPVVLGTGGDLKNSLAVIQGSQLVQGPHVGDLASPVAQEYFKQSADVLTAYLEADPTIVAVDPHPQYFSTRLAHDMTARIEEVFHHHAHAVSLLFQHGRTEPALFAVFDGTGYGTDGTIWGGEFLFADREQFSRLGNLALFPLPGGEAAIREPVRILAGLLGQSRVRLDEFLPLLGEYGEKAPLWLEMVRKGLNSPLTSSAGRLFDAVAAAVGFTRSVTFEGQAAMWLESISDKAELGSYEIHFSQESPLVADVADLTREVARDVLSGTGKDVVAARFHNTMAALIVEAAKRMSARTGCSVVGLTGGCFQNRFLTERAAALLREGGFHVLLHETIPPNDGGIALGQVVAAQARYARRQAARAD
jgi:hydrogenase maturation protein HypF